MAPSGAVMKFPPRLLARRCTLAALLTCGSFAARAQGPVVARAGSGTTVQVAPGGTLAVPFTIDRTAAQNTTLSNLTLIVAFDPTRLVFDSAAFGGFLADYSTGTGGVPLNLFMSGSTAG